MRYKLKLTVQLKKNLIVNQCIIINTLKLKWKFTMIEYIQTSSVIKYQKKMNIVCVHKIFLEEFRRKQICDERKIVIKINEDFSYSKWVNNLEILFSWSSSFYYI